MFTIEILLLFIVLIGPRYASLISLLVGRNRCYGYSIFPSIIINNCAMTTIDQVVPNSLNYTDVKPQAIETNIQLVKYLPSTQIDG